MELIELYSVVMGDGPILTKIALILPTLMVIAKGITAITPTKADDQFIAAWYNPIMKVINLFALNVGKAKNADEAIPDKQVRDHIEGITKSVDANVVRDKLFELLPGR